MAKLTIDWSDRECKIFDLVFVIQLKSVSGNKSLEELIIENHEELDITEDSLRGYLQNSEYRVMIILDGLDEYKLGRNAIVDRFINRGLGATVLNGLLLITTRAEMPNLHVIEKKMNEVLVLTGFNEENSKIFVEKFFKRFGSEHLSSAFLMEEIGDLFRVPIILLMTCFLYKTKRDHSLPTKKTEIVGAVIDFMMDRRRLKKLSEEEKKEIKIRIGKIALEAAQSMTAINPVGFTI